MEQSDPHILHPPDNLDEESVDLARFRAEWKAEVDRRRRLAEGAGSGLETATEHQVEQQSIFKRPASRVTTGTHNHESTSTAPNTSHPAIKNGTVTSVASSPALNNALAIYRKAVQHEQSGDLDAALASYRQAFRLDPYVDRAFQREELLHAKLQSRTEKVPVSSAVSPNKDLQQLSAKQPAKERDTAPGHLHVSLTRIIKTFPEDLKFEPEDETRPVILNILPTELIYVVIRKMNVAAVERFSRVCRKARVLTLDPGYWSELVRTTYKPPQLPTQEDLLLIVRKYNPNLRQLYIEYPRVRTDGLYIAICHYTRPGLSENSWVNINHLITYHRYLRFYPNGQVLSLLANEEMGPQQVIPILKPTLRMKGFFIGNWYLTGTALNIVNLVDSGKYLVPGHDLTPDLSTVGIGRPTLPVGEGICMADKIGSAPAPSASTLTPTRDHSHSYGRGAHHGQGYGHGGSSVVAPTQIRYVFDMCLDLRSKPLGRWNKLDMVTYDSVNLETGEVHAVPLKHDKPFWFSKVRSYS